LTRLGVVLHDEVGAEVPRLTTVSRKAELGHGKLLVENVTIEYASIELYL
jgi:hypothetical protein